MNVGIYVRNICADTFSSFRIHIISSCSHDTVRVPMIFQSYVHILCKNFKLLKCSCVRSPLLKFAVLVINNVCIYC